MHRQRMTALAAVFVLVIALAPASTSSVIADPDPAARFEQISIGDIANPAILPYGANPSGRVTVFVQLQGNSVAEARANAASNKISDADKAAIKDSLKTEQEALRPDIESRGGTVDGEYQSAINGLKIEIGRDRLSEIAALPGVTAILPLQTFTLDNAVSVPFLGVPTVWNGAAGFRGEGVKVGIIDTGIDYTHANFGGPGTVAAYTAAHAASTSPADPALFGPSAPKVKGGIDLVGDAYNASAPAGDPALTPHPDPNPLDCNGHGSHVAGTAAGFGVTAVGATYAGPYDATTPSNSFRIGPGVAPRADLYAIRVFGCSGSTNVVVDALDWAVDHDMDVVNMSLGSSFGSATTADAIASDNAAKAGIVVVASAGNSGAAPYITGSPASASDAISVAAIDSTASFAGATLARSGAANLTAINANGASFSDGLALPVKVLKNPDGTISLGCNKADYIAAGVTGKIVVTARGTCARVARAVFGQQAGAAAVIMLNNAAGFPPFEGQITGNPDTGEQFLVTIPFLGVPLTTANTASLLAADGSTYTLTNTAIANPSFRGFASFTSGGPRIGDSALKPDISAPGVSILSTASGTGNSGEILSGTSMAAPHVSGVAALTRQAHPTWSSADIRAAIVNTGDPGGLASYKASLGGSGLVQPIGSTRTQTIATTDKRGTNLSFGYRELAGNFSDSKDITLNNRGSSPASFNVSVTNASGSPHTVSLSRTSLTVPAGGSSSISVTLNVPAATAGNSSAFHEVAGVVTFTPASAADNAGATLRVPYYLVPRAVSALMTKLDGALDPTTSTSTTATIRNNGVIAGSADFYAWGLVDHKDKKKDKQGSVELRAAGVQSFPFPSTTDPNRRLIVFAINTLNRWSNAASDEFDVLIDVNGDGTPDFDVVGFDLGALTAGAFNGRVAAFVINLRTGTASVNFLANAPMNGTTIELPILSSRLVDPGHPGGAIGISTTNPRFTYAVKSFDLLGPDQDTLPGTATYNVWNPAISQGDFVTVSPGATGTSTVSINSAEWANSPALGVFIATLDNRDGTKQVQLISVPANGPGD
jgi:minor extracellular serine protease Vpr